MAQLLVELFSEEIPARFQAGAERDLQRLAREGLALARLDFTELRSFCGPRRLTLVVDGIPERQPDLAEERKGPRVGAPAAATDGFLGRGGAHRSDLIERDGVYFLRVSQPGGPAASAIAALVEGLVRQFPWPKSMRWADGALRWVRPLHRILCVLGGEIVPLTIEGVVAGDLSEGHRSMGAGQPFRARGFDEYREGLLGHFVLLEAAERRARISQGAAALAKAKGLALIEDPGLLEETAGLAEWPVAILGDMDRRFLTLPPEVIRTSMRVHQRYFALQDASGALAPHFVMIANIEARDGGALTAAVAARVLSARLEDARFFFDEDSRSPLETHLARLAGVTFHAKLGSLLDRGRRLEALAGEIASLVGADPTEARRAALLAKADLVTSMVGEFPELQGIMGGYYARASETAAVARAIAEHYRPQGPGVTAPSAPVSIAVALADKLDTLTGFFAIGEAPTGSRDPYGLRRAALGVIRIILDNDVRAPLSGLVARSLATHGRQADDAGLLGFFADRLKVAMREDGKRHDLVDAAFAVGDDDLVRLVARVEALGRFLDSKAGANLLAGYKRGANILAAEARKGPLPGGEPIAASDAPAQEAALGTALAQTRPVLAAALADEDFAGAMSALAHLRAPLDAFFDRVLVNSGVADERDRRLRLLVAIRAAMEEVADFSKVSG